MATTKGIASPVLTRIGKNIRRIRGEHTQAEFCTQGGIDQSVLSRIENGVYQSLDVDLMVKIAIAGHASIEDVLDGCDMAMDIVRHNLKVAAA